MASIASRRGLQALVTRPREEAEKLATALAARGIETLIEPMLQVHFRSAASPDLTGVQAVLCTSANGVRALARASAERRLPLLAVGDATAERAHAEGFSRARGVCSMFAAAPLPATSPVICVVAASPSNAPSSMRPGRSGS
jgi:Uroporphyrinogen-III synthase HemD